MKFLYFIAATITAGVFVYLKRPIEMLLCLNIATTIGCSWDIEQKLEDGK